MLLRNRGEIDSESAKGFASTLDSLLLAVHLLE